MWTVVEGGWGQEIQLEWLLFLFGKEIIKADFGIGN